MEYKSRTSQTTTTKNTVSERISSGPHKTALIYTYIFITLICCIYLSIYPLVRSAYVNTAVINKKQLQSKGSILLSQAFSVLRHHQIQVYYSNVHLITLFSVFCVWSKNILVSMIMFKLLQLCQSLNIFIKYFSFLCYGGCVLGTQTQDSQEGHD